MSAKKILVVDDDQIFCKLIANTLMDAGYETQTAFNGGAALDAYKKGQPDLILLDLAMPDKNGFEVASEIRKQEAPGKHTLIVIMTAYARSFTVSVEFEAGIDSYLTKPILPDDVVAHIATLTA